MNADKLSNEMLRLFEKCPVCGGEVVGKTVEKLVRGGVHTAVLRVWAEVCLHCGERLYPPETVKRFEEVRRKLAANEVEEFTRVGVSFEVG